jgi:hypothetical protein
MTSLHVRVAGRTAIVVVRDLGENLPGEGEVVAFESS